MNLTKPQKLIYDMEKFTGGTIAIVCGSMLIGTDKSVNEMKKTVNELYRLNDALRIRVSEENGQPYQYVTEYKEQDIEVLSFNSKEELDAYASRYAKEPLDFYGSLCDIKIVVLPDKKGVLAKLHHFISDAWTLSLIGTQFNKILNGEEVQVYYYADYVTAEEKYIDSKRYAKDKDYFISQFKKCDEVTYISEKLAHTFEAKRATFVIDKEDTSKILAYTKEKEISAFSLFMSAVATYMNRTKMNADKFYIGTAVLNRNGSKEQNTMGMFINTAPILIELNNEVSFAENLNSVELSALAVLRHQKYNYGDLLEELRNNHKLNEKLYDIMLSYQNAKILGDEVETTWYHSGMQTESLQIHIDDRDNEGIFTIHYDYLEEKFTENEISKLHEHICNLLFSAIKDEGKKLYELDILTQEEKNTLLFDFNDTAVDYPRDKCVHQLFEEQVEKNPDKVAVVACDKTLTYKELNEEANRIAHSLIEKGIGRGDIVAFMLPRRSYLIATMIGILKSGAAYMPIDPDYPQDRIDYMIKDSEAKLLVTESLVKEFLKDTYTQNCCNIDISTNNPCYYLFTSGTTGRPKATGIRHYNLSNFSNNNNNNYQNDLVNTCNMVLALSTIVFDISVFEIFVTLLNGLTLVFASENEINSPKALASFIKTNKVEVIHTTPSKISLYLDNYDFQQVASQLKMLMIGAEVFSPELFEKLSKYTSATIYNGYGPTETTIGVCFSRLNNYKCVHELFEEQVEKNPDKVAVVACDKTLTYKELNEEANRIAHSLIEKDIGRGDIVAFMLPRRSYLIATMLGILKSGAAYMPIDPDYPQDRIEYMLSDSGAKFCVTDKNISELLDNSNVNNPDAIVDGTDNCYCIYTSGSTGKPKGTLLTHSNVANYADNNNNNNNNNNVVHKIIKENYKNIVSVTTVGFDIFVTESLLPLANGMEIVLANEEQAKLQSKLNELIESDPVDVLQTTPTKMKSLIADKEQLDYLKALKVIILGGEALEETLVEELKALTDAEIFNIYGPTEATVWVTNAEIKDKDITIGKPIANTQIYIVDKYMKPVPVGVTGELCIAGDCVGAGYLNRPELTAEKFIDNPFGEGKMYKTGDLAYWREDGNIAYVGRNDFQVKIRGLRIELGEIENAISSVDGINLSVVVVRKNSEGRQLICAFYTGEEKSAQEIKSVIGEKLPKYMLPHIFTHLYEMPLTSSGKISRKTLPEIDLENIETTVEFIAPETEEEAVLVDSIKAVLSCEKVSTLDNFFDIGGDSLKAIELTSQLESRGYDVQIRTIFDCDTVQDLAKELTKKVTETAKVEYGNVIPATPAQMRVYTAQSKNSDSTLYNIPYVFKVDSLDAEKLQNAVNKLIERHESLRTHFENQNGHIMQVIDESANVTVEALSSDDILSFIRPFDLEKSPLVRVGYYENTVMIDIHHIISDGGTMPVFFRELNELYMGRDIGTDVVQYGEFAVQEVNLKESEKYWLSVFEDEIPVLELPTDIARTDKQSFNGSSVYDVIDIELHNKITAKCKELNITPYVFYMSCFNILLSKFSGNEDIVVGMPVSGRNAKYLDTIGMFVNTIALRNKPEGNKTIVELLNEVKANSVSAIDNQNYPFGELVKKLGIETSGRNPLFDVMFAYQSEQMTDVVFGDKKAELLPAPITSSKCDLTFNIMPRNNDVVVMAEYCTDLYKEKKIQKFVDAFKLILEQSLYENTFIKDIEAMDEVEKNTLLFGFNDTAVDYPRDKCVHQLFEEQVAKTPDNVAVVACDKTLTYAELNEEANRIAHSLIEKGIGRGDIVAFMLPRRSYLIASMLGILKSGAAYMPIDPDYPQDRIEYMLKDSCSKFCVTEETISELLNNPKSDNSDIIVDDADNCYCIYTSGSTGKPKGTLITHHNVVNYVNNNNNNNVVHKIIREGYRNIVSVTTVGFDIFVTESLLPLANGMEIILASEEQAKLQGKLNDLIKSNPADVLQTTPTKMKSLIVDKEQLDYLKTLKVIILGGEALEETLVEELKTLTNAEIFNIYGPTEATVWVSNTHINDAYNKKSTTNVKELFETAVNKYAHGIALVATDKILTYQELNKESNKIAHSLIERKIDVGDIVAFALTRKSYHIAVMLGIIKAGAAYLPIDPNYPQDRIEYMLKDSGAKFYITENNVYDLLSNSDDTNPDIDIKNADNCYCIYTSGSTGVPKGVVVNHNNVVNFCMDCRQNHFQHLLITKCKSILSINNTIFDITLQETILPLVNGVKVLLADNYGMHDIQQVLPLMQDNNTGLILTPTKMKIYLSDTSFCDALKNFSVIMIGAEELSGDLVSNVKKHTDAVIVNGYGPTETTCGVTYASVDSIDIHIGKPIANTQIYIVDKYMKPVPIGVTGELCIAGDCVGAGYLNRPELTAEKFIDNPFGEGKMYKTGDLAYWREDGNIAYVGRNDFQVKIRGLRIELGEIENAISSVDGINMSVVVVRKNNDGRQLICAFYTGEEKSAQEIKAVIGEKLPKYMLPHVFTHLDEMPLTSSGKTNRNALPVVDLENIGSDREYVEPETPMQKALCKILEQVFDAKQVGIADDFFDDLGGDSLKVIEFVAEAHSEGIYFALQNVFDYPTIEKLCEFIEKGDEVKLQFADYDYSKVNEVLKQNKIEYISKPTKRDVGNILLAGATGYLGIHILADFLDNDNGIAYCLVRGKNQEESEKRFNELLNFYFDDKYNDTDRIVAICADLQKDKFGLTDSEYEKLLDNVDTVINCAASVKHYGSYKYFYEANVETTKRLIEFTKQADAVLMHTSTLSVSGNSFADQFDGYISETEKHFFESSLYIEQSLENVYARSKFEAEIAVLEAIYDGLPAQIMRMGNLTNRFNDGKFQKNYESNAFLQRIRAVINLGVVPDYLMELYSEFTPIDEAAEAVMAIARHFNNKQTVFHINSTKVVYLDKLLEFMIALDISMKTVSEKEFSAVLRKTMEQTQSKHIFEAFIGDMDENDRLNYDSNIRIENDFTVEYLRKLGFEWNNIDFEYIKKYIEYFKMIGYLRLQ